MSRHDRPFALLGPIVVGCLLSLLVTGCGERPELHPAPHEWLRVQVLPLSPEHDPEGIESVVEGGGSFTHAALVHSPDEEEVLFRRWDRSIVLAVAGRWLGPDDAEPVPGARAWLEEAEVGDVRLFPFDGATVLLRLAERVREGEGVLALEPEALLASLGSHSVRLRVRRESPPVLCDPLRLVEYLESMADRSAGEWAESGPRWLALAQLLDSDALRMRVLWLWSSAANREHRMREAAGLLSSLLDLAEAHRLSDRGRGLIARQLAEVYRHGLAPFRGMEVLRQQVQTLSGEGLYVVLTTLAEEYADLGLPDRAHSVLDEVDVVAQEVDHVHGANHHLVRARLFARSDRFGEAVAAAEAGERFALTVMHVEDHVQALRLRAEILLEAGDVEAARKLATINLGRARALAGSGGDHDACTVPGLHLLRRVRQAEGEPAAVDELEETILDHVRRYHRPLDASIDVSLLAADHLARDSDRGAELFREARSLSRRAGANHVTLEARLALLRWSLRTGRERALADEVALELFQAFSLGSIGDSHLPIVSTAAKESETLAGFQLIRYWIARGDRFRAIRSAERLLAANVARSLLVLTSSPRRMDWLAPGREAVEPGQSGGRQAIPTPPRPGEAAPVDPATSERLEDLARSLDFALDEETTYHYGRVLAPDDLFVAYLLDDLEAYRLSWFRGVSRLDLLGGGPHPPARRIRQLLDEVIALGSEARRSPEGERAAAEAFRLLFGQLEEELEQAGRVLISPGADLSDLPFGLLRTGSGYLAFQLPLVYVDTGLPLPPASGGGGERPVASPLFADPFGDLPATREALRETVAGLPEADLHLGSEASEARLWRLDGRLRLLHLDTHARLELRQGVQQAVLQLNPGDGEDGEILLGEWLERFRSRPEIVSLLACQSGVSRHAESRDLDRPGAMLAAMGVPWVLSTFWRVGDEPSACLASSLVPRLIRGDDPDAALFHTLLELPERCPPGSPSQWAPYRLSVSGLREGFR